MIWTAVREAVVIGRPGLLRIQLHVPELGKELKRVVFDIPVDPKGVPLALPQHDVARGPQELVLTAVSVRPLTSPLARFSIFGGIQALPPARACT